jgi:putative ABC transport system permease protein
MQNLILTSIIRRTSRRPVRSLLTILQVALGAFAVAVIFGLIAGNRTSVVEPNVFTVIAGSRGTNGSGNVAYGLFKATDLKALLKTVPSLEMIGIYGNNYAVTVEALGRRYKLNNSGVVSPEFSQIIKTEFVAGQMYTEQDIKGSVRPVIISTVIANRVFGRTDVIGKNILISEGWGISRKMVLHKIFGVFKDPSTGNFIIDQFQFHLLLAPQNNESSQLIVKAKLGTQAQAKEEILSAVRSYYKDNSAFKRMKKGVYISTLNERLGNQDNFDPAILILSLIGIITLMICSVGIFSIQLVSTTERTKEIGMRRALGARKSSILLESLGESVVLAGIGAIFGFGLILMLMPVLTQYLQFITLEITAFVLLEVMVLVLGMAILFGLYPAVLASRISPVLALKES